MKAFTEAPGFLSKNVELGVGSDKLAGGVAKECMMQKLIDQCSLGVPVDGDGADVEALEWRPFDGRRGGPNNTQGASRFAILIWQGHRSISGLYFGTHEPRFQCEWAIWLLAPLNRPLSCEEG